jgi:NAD(P)-dependent dehydrogenase (short-subunit alcohol dehydrogenase family)
MATSKRTTLVTGASGLAGGYMLALVEHGGWIVIAVSRRKQKYRFEEVAAWNYPDNVFVSDYDIVSDTSKARRFAFHDLVDTAEMFLRMFSDFRRDRIIPCLADSGDGIQR